VDTSNFVASNASKLAMGFVTIVCEFYIDLYIICICDADQMSFFSTPCWFYLHTILCLNSYMAQMPFVFKMFIKNVFLLILSQL
jgi:hypothetical protein